MNAEVGVRLNKTFLSLIHEVGGYENFSFMEQDIRNYVSEQKHVLGKQGDKKAFLKHSHKCGN